MEEKILPKIQILFAILFGLTVIFAPFLFRSLEGILLLAASVGLGLGIVTLLLGWAIVIREKTVIYPFREWSLPLLRLIYGEQTVSGLEKKRRRVPSSSQRWLGIASLVGGGLVVLLTLGTLVFALSNL
jgi:hypothetical protein